VYRHSVSPPENKKKKRRHQRVFAESTMKPKALCAYEGLSHEVRMFDFPISTHLICSVPFMLAVGIWMKWPVSFLSYFDTPAPACLAVVITYWLLLVIAAICYMMFITPRSTKLH
jgi:hypothetical protein